MNTIDLSTWLQFFARLGIGLCAVAGLALIAQLFCKSSSWRRAIWQIALICSLLIAAIEVTGASKGLGIWLFGKTAPQRVVSVRVFDPAPEFIPSFTEETVAVSSVPISDAVFELPKNCWWPAMLWLVGGALVLGRILFAQGVFVAFRSKRKRLTDAGLLADIKLLSEQLGLRRRVRVYELQRVSGPIAFGIARPSIGVPRGFAEQFTPAQQQAMLAHELAHLRAHDPLWYLIANIVTAVFWWHPGAWWMRRQLHVASEFAADEAVTLLENGPITLAECLVTFGRQLTASRPMNALGVGGFRSNLGKRVEALLNLKERPFHSGKAWHQTVVKIIAPICLVALLVCTVGWFENRETQKGRDFSSTVQGSWGNSMVALTLAAVKEERETRYPFAGEDKSATDTQLPRENAKLVTGFLKVDATALLAKLEIREQVVETDEESRVFGNGQIVTTRPDSSQLAFVSYLTKNGITFETEIESVLLYIQSEEVIVRASSSKLEKLKDLLKPILESYSVGSSSNSDVNYIFLIDPDKLLQQAVSQVGKVDSEKSIQTIFRYLKAQGISLKPRYALYFHNKSNLLCVRADDASIIKLEKLLNVKAVPLPDSVKPETIVFLKTHQKENAAGKPDALGLHTRIYTPTNPPKYFVRADEENLELIEQSVQQLNRPTPQVTISTEIIELDDATAKSLGFEWFLSGELGRGFIPHVQNRLGKSFVSAVSTNLSFVSGVLPPKQYNVVSRALKQKNLETLSAPRVTTLSGRQVQISMSPDIPMLDYIPIVQADGIGIHLTTEILADTSLVAAGLAARERKGEVTIYDGQTAVVSTESFGDPGRRWVCFVTVTLIDKTGKPVHSQEELLFTNESIPPQGPVTVKE
ncbi:MAG: hypothetical protein H0X66_19585 [Verrucomicrobia bacterium]|nr:hypothetical protein [Verrucomicrobiota bacterium]